MHFGWLVHSISNSTAERYPTRHRQIWPQLEKRRPTSDAITLAFPVASPSSPIESSTLQEVYHACSSCVFGTEVNQG